MNNPPNSDQNSGSYVDLLERMTRTVMEHHIDNQILELIKQVFDHKLEIENIGLTDPEKKRLLRQVTQAVLIKLLENVDNRA